MFLLDTNVISELTKPAPSAAVLGWFAATPAQQIFLSTVTLCEIQLGLALMPVGKRRDALVLAADALVQIDFAGRCLNLDTRCAPVYGQLAAQQHARGRTCSVEDAMIAAVAITNEMLLVTRNTKDFEGIAGLALVNPWLVASG